MTSIKPILLAAALLTWTSALTAACTGDVVPSEVPQGPGETVGGEDNTFDHPDPSIDPFDLLDRLTQEGPPSYTSRVHSCPKMRYTTLGRVLASRGVNVTNNANLSAGQLYQQGTTALGRGNLAVRARESLEVTTAQSTKQFDIFAQAATEVIANLPSRAECQIGGVGVQMFTGNQCNADAIACLIGVPATQAHVDLCNLTVTQASDVERGKRMAVAAILAAGQTCE